MAAVSCERIIEASDLECPICLTVFERPVQLSCGHTVCAECTARMIEAERDNNPYLEFQAVINDDRPRRFIGDPFRRRYEIHRRIARDRDEVLRDHNYPQLGRPLPEMVVGGVADNVADGQDQFPAIEPLAFADPFDLPRPRRERGQRGTLRCPECRKVTIVPADGLPTNFTVLHMVQRVKRLREQGNTPIMPIQQQVDRLPCEECREPMRAEMHFVCADCNSQKSLCAHCAITSHKGHNVIEQSAIDSQEINELQSFYNGMRDLVAKAQVEVTRTLNAIEAQNREVRDVSDYLFPHSLPQMLGHHVPDVECLETALQFAGRTGDRHLFDAAANGITVVKQIFESVHAKMKAFTDGPAKEYVEEQQTTIETLREVVAPFLNFSKNKDQDSHILAKIREEVEARRREQKFKFLQRSPAMIAALAKDKERRKKESFGVRLANQARLDRKKKHVTWKTANDSDSDTDSAPAGLRKIKLEPEETVDADMPGPSGLNVAFVVGRRDEGGNATASTHVDEHETAMEDEGPLPIIREDVDA